MCMFPASRFHQRTYMPQGLVNGVLNDTCLNDFQLAMGFYRGHSSLFLRVCLPEPALPHLSLMFACVCVCVLEWFQISRTFIFSVCL